MFLNVLYHIFELFDEPGTIVFGNAVGGMYPVSDVQLLNVMLNIELVLVADDVLMVLNNPAGIDVIWVLENVS